VKDQVSHPYKTKGNYHLTRTQTAD